MDIRKSFATSMVSAVLILASGIPSFAKNSRTVQIPHDAVLGGTTLAAGQYVVLWESHSPEATVQFQRGRKVVLSTQGKFEDRGKTYDRNAVVYNVASDGHMTISEIRFAGSSQALVFNQ